MYSYINNNLHCENVNISELYNKIGSSFYCYSSEILESQFTKINDAFKGKDFTVCYSLKANSNQSIIRTFSLMGSGADVVSLGELKRALKENIPTDKIVFSGVGKTTEEIDYAINQEIMMINVESIPELKKISERASSLNKVAPISIRINPDIVAGDNEKISTGKKQDKFGINIEGSLNAYELASSLNNINIKGIDIHIGSQINSLDPFEKAFDNLLEIIQNLESKNINIDIIDVGGGIGVNYNNDKTININDYARLINNKFDHLNKKIVLEPGRFLTAESGILVTKVIYIKKTESKNFLIVDTAMNDFIRPSLYGAEHNVIPLIEDTSNIRSETFDVVGPICETGDYFAKDYKISNVKEDDLLAVTYVGAYGSVLSSNYNSRESLPEVLIKGADHFVIRNRININNLIGKDEIAKWL